jgi:hypothetical protein
MPGERRRDDYAAASLANRERCEMILIRRRSEGIVGVAIPPHVREAWIVSTPIEPDDFHKQMIAQGCHPVDSADVILESKNSGFGYLP